MHRSPKPHTCQLSPVVAQMLSCTSVHKEWNACRFPTPPTCWLSYALAKLLIPGELQRPVSYLGCA